MRDFRLELRVGEVVGLTGLLGMGFDEVPYALFGASPAKSGVMRIGGVDYELPQLTPRKSIVAGMALLPANRARDGSVGKATVTENVTLPSIGQDLGGRSTAAVSGIATGSGYSWTPFESTPLSLVASSPHSAVAISRNAWWPNGLKRIQASCCFMSQRKESTLGQSVRSSVKFVTRRLGACL